MHIDQIRASFTEEYQQDVLSSEMEGEQPNAIVEAVQQALLLSLAPALKDAINNSTDIKQLKRKSRTLPEFNKKGNKLRYETNDEILEKIEESLEAIGSNRLQDAHESLTQGKNLMLKQQKLIRLADRESDGWEVVKHYMSDDLADDSADEKTIKKARKNAKVSKKERLDKKRIESKRGRFRNDGRKYEGRRYESDRTYERGESSRAYGGDKRGPLHTHKSTICYNCGRLGHFQSFCPNKFRR